VKLLAALLAMALAAAPIGHHHRRACARHHRCPAPHAATPAPSATPSAAPIPTAPPAPTVVATPVATPLPTRTSVTFDDTRDPWTLAPAHATLAAGPVTFTAYDYGQDDHNLSVDSEDRTIHYGSLDVPTGSTDDPPALTVDLPAGHYVLFCNLPGHELAGMAYTITVRQGAH
jgi:plastocyanin